ncbi:hypothetical protein HOY80DRAFT_588438 [Tuber brumale]|nr:hypothetical protein HOY80DRAFT_588438 [Tuber brumale]
MIVRRLLLSLISLSITPVFSQNFSAIWSPSTGKTKFYTSISWNNFTSSYSSIEAGGYTLDDLEVATFGNETTFHGLFRTAASPSVLYTSTDFTGFIKKWEEYEKSGLLMHNFETYEIAGAMHYAGVFHEVAGKQTRHFTTSKLDAIRAREEAVASGYQTQDFETYVVNGTRWFAGIFRQGGNGEERAWVTTDFDEFVRMWQEFRDSGLRLWDYEEYIDNGTRVYAGFFRAGKETGKYEKLFGGDAEMFAGMRHRLEGKGMVVDDFEVTESTCPATCLNQVSNPPSEVAYIYPLAETSLHCEGPPGTCNGTGQVEYSQPTYDEEGSRFLEPDIVNEISQLFTLPFRNNKIKHNGWLYLSNIWHYAIDYYTDEFGPFGVHAAAPGKVIFVGWNDYAGNTIIISHKRDRYRTIYMHIRNGAEADCKASETLSLRFLREATQSTPEFLPVLSNFTKYLADTSCNSTSPSTVHWGEANDAIAVAPGDAVKRGQKLGVAGSTGPGGCGCIFGGSKANNHLHIFFAKKNGAGKWYFFDPYGIYAPPECYPTSNDVSIPLTDTSCARYPSGWKGGKPGFA